MAQAHEADKAKLICGIITGRAELFARAAEILADALGAIDLTGPIMPFDLTDYYEDKMGPKLQRQFVSFDRLIRPDMLVDIKHRTNEIESRLAACQASCGPARPINLDPGYVEPAKLVLASMKNFSHRIYLGRGVYAEVTLMYRKGRWEPLAWTFPDFASGRYDAFLTDVRNLLRQVQRKE